MPARGTRLACSPRLSAWRRRAQSRPRHRARPAERGGQEQQLVRAGREESVSSAFASPPVAWPALVIFEARDYLRASRVTTGTVRVGEPHPQNDEWRQHARPQPADPAAGRAHERHGDDTPDERPRDDDCGLHFRECHVLTVAARSGRRCAGLHTSRRLNPVMSRLARRRCRSAFHRQGPPQGVRHPCGRDERWRRAPCCNRRCCAARNSLFIRSRRCPGSTASSTLSASIADALGDRPSRSAPKLSRHQRRHDRQACHNYPIRNGLGIERERREAHHHRPGSRRAASFLIRSTSQASVGSAGIGPLSRIERGAVWAWRERPTCAAMGTYRDQS